MGNEPYDKNWEMLSQDVLTGMREWRLQHPKATLRGRAGSVLPR